MSPDDLREFQRAHTDPFGKPLSVDGVLGPKTQWALDLFSCSPRRDMYTGVSVMSCSGAMFQ